MADRFGVLDPRELRRKMPLSLWIQWRAFAKLSGAFDPNQALREDYHAARQLMMTAAPYLEERDRDEAKFLPLAWRRPADYARWGLFPERKREFTIE